MATSRLDRRPCLLPAGKAPSTTNLVFTASNPGLFSQEAWIRGYHCGSEKGCEQTDTATLDTTLFSIKLK